MSDNLSGSLFPFQDNAVIFGDLHLWWDALQVILDEARRLDINTALNLGDEDTFVGGPPGHYDKLFGQLRDYRDEKKNRRLICVIGDKTGGVKPYIKRNYVGVNSRGRISSSIIFKEGNVIAGHAGGWILEEHSDFIKGYKGLEPLVIFHGHSHSMGVLPEFKWLSSDEFVRFLPEGEKTYHLKPGKTYWVNPGSPYSQAKDNKTAANFAVYYPRERKITLRSILFEPQD